MVVFEVRDKKQRLIEYNTKKKKKKKKKNRANAH